MSEIRTRLGGKHRHYQVNRSVIVKDTILPGEKQGVGLGNCLSASQFTPLKSWRELTGDIQAQEVSVVSDKSVVGLTRRLKEIVARVLEIWTVAFVVLALASIDEKSWLN